MTNGNSPKIAREIIDAILAYGDARADKDLVKGTASLKKSIELIRSALSVCADGGKDSSDARDAERYRKCRERSITNGVAESAEHFDKMVDESIERVEVKLRTGHNYGKKMQPNGTLK